MAIRAYVLIEAAVGKVARVVKALRQIHDISEVDVVAGPYDIIVRIEAPSADAVGRLVMEKIHQIEGINYTMTCVSVDG